MRTETVREIQKRLKRWRKQTMKDERLTQSMFAAKAKLGMSTIKELLAGSPDAFNPGIATLSLFLDACGKTLGDLFDFLIPRMQDDVTVVVQRAKDTPYGRIQLKALMDIVKESERL